MNSLIRPEAVAGVFYPKDADELRQTVRECLDAAPIHTIQPKAIIVPHAGYIYSAAVAASAYKCLFNIRDRIKRVVLLGPSHRVPFVGVASSRADAFATPLGSIACDRTFAEKLQKKNLVEPLDLAHEQEHSLEVHLPFLRECLRDFSIVPLVVGDVKKDDMEAVIAAVWNDESTLVVVSSDLSHYLHYNEACFVDRKTSAKIESLDASLTGEQACGCRPLNGLLSFCKQHNLAVTNLDLRNSGDTAGTRDRVVGYGAYVVH